MKAGTAMGKRKMERIKKECKKKVRKHDMILGCPKIHELRILVLYDVETNTVYDVSFMSGFEVMRKITPFFTDFRKTLA